ncbi:hypothetical protein BpHYR1_003141 [Brachionus plicatilis]|uniref:Uncharacterized protein n=1 Tax=Brachionus plicatilis TaxID=10195 RepID=A0A3M7QBJ8_BRAPC|nr:hypothetical protein BpHYR1_003141 [Brachionus plicatilis]
MSFFMGKNCIKFLQTLTACESWHDLTSSFLRPLKIFTELQNKIFLANHQVKRKRKFLKEKKKKEKREVIHGIFMDAI